MGKQGNAGERKHVTLMIPQKLVVIGGLKAAQVRTCSGLHTTLDYQLRTI